MARMSLSMVVLAGCLAASAMGCRPDPCGPGSAAPSKTPAAAEAAETPQSTLDEVEEQAAPVPPERGAFETRKYRNLFVERGRTAAEVDEKIKAAYEQLFHGDVNEQTVMYAGPKNKNGPTAYVQDIANADVRSEGMSYGMMIAVQMDRKADFDAIWNWARTYTYHDSPKHPAYGYFSWQMKPEGKPMDEMPAPDGEEYFITALYFAAHRWGSGKGIYDYAAEANRILRDVKNRKPITGRAHGYKGPATITAGALFNVQEHQVRFTPDHGNFKVNGDHTDPSYHLPAFYELWAQWGPAEDKEFWVETARVSRDFFIKTTNPDTGLAPDYANFDGSPKAASWDENTATFRFDAFRTAMNWAVDHEWWAKDPREIELSDRIQKFFDGQGIQTYGNNFTLDGKPTSHDHSTGLVATNAVASLAASQSRAWKFVDALWAASVPSGKYRYYDGMLYMMSMLHVSGKFQIYHPPS
jgi:oligosaccharide reducing-end xylanase